MRAQTEKTTCTCKDDFLLTKRTRRWTYSALLYFYIMSSFGLWKDKIMYKKITFDSFHGCLIVFDIMNGSNQMKPNTWATYSLVGYNTAAFQHLLGWIFMAYQEVIGCTSK